MSNQHSSKTKWLCVWGLFVVSAALLKLFHWGSWHLRIICEFLQMFPKKNVHLTFLCPWKSGKKNIYPFCNCTSVLLPFTPLLNVTPPHTYMHPLTPVTLRGGHPAPHPETWHPWLTGLTGATMLWCQKSYPMTDIYTYKNIFILFWFPAKLCVGCLILPSVVKVEKGSRFPPLCCSLHLWKCTGAETIMWAVWDPD